MAVKGLPSVRSIGWGIAFGLLAIFLWQQFPALQNLTRPR